MSNQNPPRSMPSNSLHALTPEELNALWNATVLPNEPPKCECGKLITAEGDRIDRARDILRVIVEAADSGSAERLAVSINAARSLLRK